MLPVLRLGLLMTLAPTPSVLPYFAIPQAEYWRHLVDLHIDDFEYLNDSDLAVSVIAWESWGNRYAEAVSPNGNMDVGLMMITADRWAGSYEDLKDPSFNVWTGMWILDNILQKTDGDTRWALAAYSCGFESLEADKCYSFGGWTYADNILNYVYPEVTQ